MLSGFQRTTVSSYSLFTKRTKMSATPALKYQDPIILPAKTKPSLGTVIFLHGLGDTGHGWLDGISAIQQILPNVKFVLPHAPQRAITWNMGMLMPGWYDIIEIGMKSKEDAEGVEVSKNYVMDLVKAEVEAGTPADKIIVGGFSQGAAVSLYTVYSADVKLAGALAMSGYLPVASGVADRLEKANKTNLGTPLFQCHGTADAVVPFDYGKLSFDALQAAGIKGVFNSYKNLAHSASIKELQDVAAWIKSTLSDNKL